MEETTAEDDEEIQHKPLSTIEEKDEEELGISLPTPTEPTTEIHSDMPTDLETSTKNQQDLESLRQEPILEVISPINEVELTDTSFVPKETDESTSDYPDFTNPQFETTADSFSGVAMIIPVEEYLMKAEDLDSSRLEQLPEVHTEENISLCYEDKLSTISPCTPPPTPTDPHEVKAVESELEALKLYSQLQFFEEVDAYVDLSDASEEHAEEIIEEENEVVRIPSATKKTNFKAEIAHDIYIETEYEQIREKRKEIEELERQQKSICRSYADVDKFASGFIDDILDTSVNKIKEQQMKFSTRGEYSQTDEESSSVHTFVEIFGTFTRWPHIQEFTKDIGITTISDYMLTWEYTPDWLFCINFLLVQSDDCSDYYLYEAKWSIPTKAYPIPQATASVYFTMEVSRVKPPYCPIDVTYVFEGSRFVHTPGKIRFQEKWLFDIVDAKINLFKQITF